MPTLIPSGRDVVATLLLSAVLAACGTSAPTPSPPPPPTPTPTPAEGNFHAFPELEARLPSQVGGREMTKVSLAAVADEQREITHDVLRRLDRTADDVQLAVATGGEAIQVSAFRVVGADAVEIILAFQAAEEAHQDNIAVFGVTTIAGKRLVTRTTPAQTTYLYPSDDIMFVLAGTSALVEEALIQLP